MRRNIVCAILVIGIATTVVRCGPIIDFFKKAPKPKPEERVPELLIEVKTEVDDHKRASAAVELRQYDPAMYSDIVPILIDVARRDRAASVRVEAVQSLAKFRPISNEVGQLLEQAEKDPSMRVKVQAHTSLVQYRLAGYRAQKSPEPPIATPDRTPPAEIQRMPEPPRDADRLPLSPLPSRDDSDGPPLEMPK